MSSANLVRVAIIKESTYGVTTGSGNFMTARFISEGISGTPDTVESQQIRTDRMSSGQIVTGLTVGGDYGFELAPNEDALEAVLESAMFSAWDVKSLTTVDLTYTASSQELERASGNWASDGYVVGDFCTLAGFAETENNVQVMIAEIIDATTVRVVGPTTMVDETGSGTSIKRGDKLTIGTTKKSLSLEKKFLDLTEKAINYRGMIVNTMELNIAHGELVGGSFSFSGNDYQAVDANADMMTDGRTVDSAATTNTLNGSVDMPFLASSETGDLEESVLNIQSVSLNLNNNLSAQNVIGDIAPRDYSAGTAQIGVSVSAYLTDAGWEMLAKKLSQESFALGFMMKNTDGWMGFYMPAVQVSFDDPASGGQNQDVMLEMEGTAKVGSGGTSALSIYKS